MQQFFSVLKFLPIFSLIFLLAFSGCKKDDSPAKSQTVKDVDGNIYNTVVIGSQVWMKENLKVSKYRNGDTILNPQNDNDWGTTTKGAYTIYNHLVANNETYGKLYNWYAVADPRGLCPVGWHIPSDSNWTTLGKFLGGDSLAAGRMKTIGTIQSGTGLWQEPNSGATNISGFTALPAGIHYSFGPFVYLGEGTVWWSSTEESNSEIWYRSMTCISKILEREKGADKNVGWSVRCVKD
jgi:uncharacterized protein (TIGR02145 family)